MGQKKGKKNHDGGEKTKPKDKEGEDGSSSLKVVLKVDMHCEGCAKKVKRSVTGFEGVESVETDNESSKLTVVGKVDPWKLRERVEQKTHKKVTLVSPTDYPKEKKVDKQEKGDMKQMKNSDEAKPKPKPKPPVSSTVVLNILLHCEGCIQRIRRSISKVKGVEEVSFDAPKDLVIVKGIMDVKSMVPNLQNKFKRKIVIVQAAAKKDDGEKKNDKGKDNKGKDSEEVDDTKKDQMNSDEKKKKKKEGGGEKKEKKDNGGGEKKEKKDNGGGENEKKKDNGGGGGGGEKEKKTENGGGEKKEKEKEKKDNGGGEGKMESSKMEYYSGGYVPYEQHYYPQQQYQQYQQYQFPQQQQQQYYPAMVDMVHAPQMFSDENPNACSIM